MSAALKQLAVVVSFSAALFMWSLEARADCGVFGRVRWEYATNPNPQPQPGCPDPSLINVRIGVFDCGTGAHVSEDTGYNNRCPSRSSDQDILADNPDGKVIGDYLNGCRSPCSRPDPQLETCDGRQNSLTGLVDKGCGDPEHKCQMTDPFPVYLTSGRIETQPITLFSVPAPEGASFDLSVKYGSHLTRNQLQNLALKQANQTAHFLGENWTDTFSDRLMVSVVGLPTSAITWVGFQGTVTFTNPVSGVWKSASNRFELVDRGASPSDGYGRWMVRTTDAHAPRQTWLFEEITYTTNFQVNGASQQEKVGRLKRFALTTGGTDAVGSYGYDVSWATDGGIASVIDTLGRQFSFTYQSFPPGCTGSNCRYKVLQYASYKPASSATLETIATFQYAPSGTALERIVHDPIRYRRFLYWHAPASCLNCSALISHVIVPGPGNSSTPGSEAPVQSTEIVLEKHEYSASLDMRRPLVARSSGPGRSYAYVWNASDVVQLDLHQRTGGCSSGCAPGSYCLAEDQTCYVANTVQWNSERLPTLAAAQGATSVSGSGNPESRQIGYSGGAAGTIPQSSKDTGGTTTSYGYDSKARLRCIVRGDDDDVAFTNPSAPDTSDCAGPTTAQIIRVDYAAGGGGCVGGTITKTTPSLIGSSPVTESECLDSNLRSISTTQTGYTKTVGGTLISSTRTNTRAYDAVGRIIETNGPLADSIALDKSTTTYYTSFDSSWPHNFGRVHQVTRYVGTSSSSQALTTTFEEYDLYGVPHKITDPAGIVVTYTDSNNRLNWTINRGDSLYSASVGLNPDGSALYMADEDGVCLTFEYTDSGEYVGAPTKILRTNNGSCGQLPIDTNGFGEVEIRAYVHNESDRLKSIERRMDGVTQFTFGVPNSDSYLEYDRDRRILGLKTPGSSPPYAFTYTDLIRSGAVAPSGPGPGSWRTESTFDALARPTSLLRYIDTSNKQTYNFSYVSPLSPRPTQLARGYNGSSTSVTTFVYDDFGRLVEASVPEAGAPGSPAPTRYEYDVADQLTKKRIGVGTTLVSTSQYSYDSLGRVTFVDHDTEHPVNCSTAAPGTPIQDEEYKYDSCTGDAPTGVTCDAAMGQLTIARTLIQCGSAGQVIKRGRWYSYGWFGTLSSISYATVDGSTIGTAATSAMGRTPAGRESGYGSPLNAAFGTAYIDPNILTDVMGGPGGKPASIWATDWTTVIAPSVTYTAFGPVSEITTAVAEPSAGATLKMLNEFESTLDYRLRVHRWRLETFRPTISLLDQTLGYTGSGLLQTRIDTADKYASRYYGYDALMRMTCEARGDSATDPTGADCSTASTRLTSLLSYGDGQSASLPPDVRATSFLKSENPSGAACSSSNQCYASSSTETSTYASGSGQPQAVVRSASTLVVNHDALGRRTAEYDDFDPTRSRREYTYLPNGQLGSISGQTWSGTSYNIQIRYDDRGRPETIAASDLYELYWDESDRLIAASILFPAARGSAGYVAARWHYHWLGRQLIAATRELVAQDDTTDVKRFWAVSDERGFVYRLLDEQGATFWQARWDSNGWRTFVGTPQPEMWVPFALPGQVVLGRSRIVAGAGSAWAEGTEAFASGGNGTWTRPPVAINQWRVYEPLQGAFLQPDGLDSLARLDPEGYIAFRDSPLRYRDPSGRESSGTPNPYGLRFKGCRPWQETELVNATIDAVVKIHDCVTGACSGSSPVGTYLPAFNPNIKRLWLSVVQLPKVFECHAEPFNDESASADVDGPMLNLTVRVLNGSFKLGCLSGLIAHEALHPVLLSMPQNETFTSSSMTTLASWPIPSTFMGTRSVAWAVDHYVGNSAMRQYFGKGTTWMTDHKSGHSLIEPMVTTCFGCRGAGELKL